MPRNASRLSETPRQLVGQAALHASLNLRVPPPAVTSYVAAIARRTEIDGHRVVETFPKRYSSGETPLDHLRFALRHEPLDLGVLAATFKALSPDDLAAWIRAEPTGAYSRRAWFFYERLTGKTLDTPSASAGNYADALDGEKQYVSRRRPSQRHRVNDNLLGEPALCPTVRRTPKLQAHAQSGLAEEVISFAGHYDADVLARAVSFLYTKETRSSFFIEGETPGRRREERFIDALRTAAQFDPTDKRSFLELHATIMDPRYAANDWRDSQNFVGETLLSHREVVHFIPPRPEDVPGLMAGWFSLAERLLESETDPVIAAAAAAYAFVFIHPFEDGNGRIHRFLIHQVLGHRRFSPPGIIFPVSAAILRNRAAYDRTLAAFSRPLMEFVEYKVNRQDNSVHVLNETADLYRFFDATAQAEFLYDCVAETIRNDLKDELDFVTLYDRALRATQEIVDMPDRKASLFVRICLQNEGRLSHSKRPDFAELTDEEVTALEVAVKRVMDSPPAGIPAPLSGVVATS